MGFLPSSESCCLLDASRFSPSGMLLLSDLRTKQSHPSVEQSATPTEETGSFSWVCIIRSRIPPHLSISTFEFDFHHLMNIFQYVSIGLKGVTWTVDADFQTQVGLCKIRPRVRAAGGGGGDTEWQGSVSSTRARVMGNRKNSQNSE